MNEPIPVTVAEYLSQVRAALAGADPAVIQDALYDAEEHLRAELAAHRGVSESEVLRKVATSYGSPEEVAEIYRDTEITVNRALRSPAPPLRRTLLGRFFAVAADARTYGALFYMLLTLATGVMYFTLVVTGVSLSLGFSLLIIGIPFVVLFIGIVRVVSLVEGRIVETLLGVRMPRRPAFQERGLPWLTRIGRMFSDPRTWSTLLYFVLMLPLGIIYFTLAVTMLSVSLGLIAGPVVGLFIEGVQGGIFLDGKPVIPFALAFPFTVLLGLVLLFASLHLARGVAVVHGKIAHQLLVKLAIGESATAPVPQGVSGGSAAAA